MRGWIVSVVMGSFLALGVAYARRPAPASMAAASSPRAAAAANAVNCDVWSWIDVAATKGNPKLAPLRQKLLAGAADAGAVQALAAPIEEGAETIALCMATSGSQKPIKVLSIFGRFPTELAERLKHALPNAREQQVAGRAVLASSTNWVSLSETRLVWASDELALQSALEEQLVTPPLPPGLTTFTSITPRAKMPGIGQLATALGLGAREWERLSLSMPRDASSSEVRVHATSDRAAKALLQAARDQLDEVRASALPIHQRVAAKLSVEAEGMSVAFRFAGAMDELAGALQALRPQKPHGHGHGHGHD